ncbi:MAG: ParB/RepB/Spo0J family partition protein [Chloroflexota bacterium]
MAKKKTGLSQTLFQGIDPYGQAEGEDADGATLPLTAIRPDPDQPRRLLPDDLGQDVAAGRRTPMEAMRAWRQRDESGAEMSRLHRLADSIARHGLINPISVRRVAEDEQAPAGVRYFIVTGERRYWAHVLLALEGRDIHTGEAVHDPTEIRAGLTAPGITVRAHQLVENIMREDINAVEKARGLWALRCELSGVNYSSPGAADEEVNYSSLSPEHDLVPWQRVSEELGISKRYRIYLTSVLQLSPQAQALVQQHDLAEITIRPIVQKLRDEPALQLEALQQLVAWQAENEAEDGQNRAITRSVKALVDELLKRKEAGEKRGPRAAHAVDSAARTRQFRRRVRHTLRFLHDLPREDVTLLARDLALDSDFEGVAEELSDLRQQIDTLLQRVESYRQTDP